MPLYFNEIILLFGRPWGYLPKDTLSLYFTRSYINSKELFLFENGLFDLCLTFAHFTKETTIVNGGSHLLRAPVFCWGHPYEFHQPPVNTGEFKFEVQQLVKCSF